MLKKVYHSPSTVLWLSSKSDQSGTQSSGFRLDVARAREGSFPANTIRAVRDDLVHQTIATGMYHGMSRLAHRPCFLSHRRRSLSQPLVLAYQGSHLTADSSTLFLTPSARPGTFFSGTPYHRIGPALHMCKGRSWAQRAPPSASARIAFLLCEDAVREEDRPF